MLSAVVCLPENITFLATRNRATMPSLGKIEEFNSATTSINRYLERLEQYFVANSVPANSAESHKRRAILISVIGAKAYHILSDLCSPTPPSEKTSAQLTTILKNHFPPKKLVIAERYRFHNCTQREDESVTAFTANLKHLASTCQFGTCLNEALRDRFVCGLCSKETQKKLLFEEHTFDAALKVALGAKAAEKDVAAFSQESSASQGIEIPVELNGTSPLMELDTGAGVSVISEETYKKHFSGTPLRPSNTRLRAYTGHPLKRLAVPNKTRLNEDLQYSRIRDRPPTGRGFPVAHNYPQSP
ncbi:unnamed protein product [Porites lobata]|uniref:Peptidase A2 domain-containing protein n=1 Tax=Porites lobata TaxID=104759 RepID=A0ABN8PNB5_9CNID|nr:unnamed protein product [Porites lobata]